MNKFHNNHIVITFLNNNSFVKTHIVKLTENKKFYNNTYINFYTSFDFGKSILKIPQSVYKHPVRNVMCRFGQLQLHYSDERKPGS